MDKEQQLQELKHVSNTIYYVISNLNCDIEMKNELYIAVNSIERVLIQMEKEDDQ